MTSTTEPATIGSPARLAHAYLERGAMEDARQRDAIDRRGSRSRRIRKIIVGSLLVTVLSVTGVGEGIIAQSYNATVSAFRSVEERVFEDQTFAGADNYGNTFTFTLIKGGRLDFLSYNGVAAIGDRWAIRDGRLQLTVSSVPLYDGEVAEQVIYTATSKTPSLDLSLTGVDEAGRSHTLTAAAP
ncbi:hypothetical protein FQ330_03195 [Agrococcus sediminis]|uniref:Uncharacterized protein n=1 Tax=Agrococcus sediminis TaxID=2599924 RepID=A0A5M8QN62_9MICO|nr:hypothetical protein [Agrococcus sediminis]KAA6436424.1 hypothetical protein FQ330_03195 [Agrococcus sediminis]